MLIDGVKVSNTLELEQEIHAAQRLIYGCGLQYSCDACTRGHRQNSCKHADRPLHEVPKRGRPPTACAECRELRKTTNSHRTCNHRKDSDEGALLFRGRLFVRSTS